LNRIYSWAAGLTVLAVSVIAAVVSFQHIHTLALAHGYTPGTADLLPFSVDGLILSSSLALMAGARPGLSRSGLVLGVAATVAANVAYGAQHGAVGALLSAWPAVAFILASEIFIGMVRSGTGKPGPVPGGPAVPAVPENPVPENPVSGEPVPGKPVPAFAGLNGHRKKAEKMFSVDLAEGSVPGIRRIRDEMRVGQPKAQQIQAYLRTLTSSN
jgi:hypothetical protein